MTGLLLALALSAQPRVFLSVDRAFLPDAPGAVVRAELEGASTLDVRLYRLKDPARFLGEGEEGEPTQAPLPNAPRAPSPPAVLVNGVARLRQALRAQLEPVLTDAALAAARLLAPGTVVPPSHELPFLRGETLVRRWTLPCGGAESYRYCDIELGALPSGVYLVEGVADAQASYAVALVSSLALAARHVPGQVMLLAADARTGEPRGGVFVEASGPAAPALHGTTGAHGTLQLKGLDRGGRALAHAGSDWAVLQLPAVASRARGPRVWIAPGSGEVRPGAQVQFLGAERPPPAAPRELAVSLEDGRGSVVATGSAHQNALGLFSGAVRVPPQAAQGLAHLVVAVDGRPFSGELWIRDPPPPALTATASLDVHAQSAVAEVTARGGSGRLATAKVAWHLLRTPLSGADDAPAYTEVVDEGEAATDPNGRARFAIELPASPDTRYTLEATATDAWGHLASAEATAVKLVGGAHLSVIPERRVVAPGEAPHLRIEARDAWGNPVPAAVTLRTRVARIGPSGETSTAAAEEVKVEVPASGSAQLTLPPLQAGYCELEATLGGKRLAEAVLFASAKGGDIPFTPDALTLIPDRNGYTSGQTAHVLLFAPFESGTALVTIAAGESTHHEVLAIHGSSALFTFKVPPGATDLDFAAVALLNGQSFAAARSVRVLPLPGPSLRASIVASKRPGQLELSVHVADALGRPVPGAVAHAAVRAANDPPPLAPALAAYFDPEPVPEGRTDVSLDFRSAGVSTSAERAIAGSQEPLAFTPEEGLTASPARPPHATLALLERLPPTDRNGESRLAFSSADAHAVSAEVVAAVPGADPRAAPTLLEAKVEAAPAGVGAVPNLPPVLRAGDRALGQVTLLPSGAPAIVRAGSHAVSVPADAPAQANLSLDAQHPAFLVETGNRTLLSGRLPVVSGEEWVAVQAGEAPRGTTRLAGESEEGTLRLRVASGPAGLLRLLAEPPRQPVQDAEFEGLEANPVARPETDARLGALATALAATGLPLDPAGLAAPAAAVVGALGPTGELGAFPGAPVDLRRTALALWLLERAQKEGAGVPSEWIERVRGRLASEPLRADSAFTALALNAPIPALDDEALGSLEPSALAAWTLLAAEQRDARAPRLALALERSAGLSGNRACWAEDGCDPRTPASIDSLASTGWAAVALAAARPHSPRIAAALRYLLVTREQAVWGRGESAVSIPLALAEGATALPDRAAAVQLFASGDAASARLEPGGYTVLYASGGPVQLRVAGGPVFFELARARAEATGEGGELRVQRRYFRVNRQGEHDLREPLDGSVAQGELLEVELTVTGASPGQAVQLDDRFPGGLRPIVQPGQSDPVSELRSRGGAVTYLADRVHFDAVAGKAPLTVAYLAWANLAGHYVAPSAVAQAGELGGRSAQSELEIEAAP